MCFSLFLSTVFLNLNSRYLDLLSASYETVCLNADVGVLAFQLQEVPVVVMYHEQYNTETLQCLPAQASLGHKYTKPIQV